MKEMATLFGLGVIIYLLSKNNNAPQTPPSPNTEDLAKGKQEWALNGHNYKYNKNYF